MSHPGDKGYYEDYSQFLKARERWVDDFRNNPDRFVPITERTEVSLPKDIFKQLERGKYMTDWKGIGMSKDPLDLAIYQAMLQDIKPRTIIELGVLRGGSIVWFADQVKMFELDCRVIGFDIDYSYLHDNAKNRNDITFLTGDSNEIEKTFTAQLMEKLPHPWIIVEDAHAYLEHVVEHFNTFMKPGDYFVVEDGHPVTNTNTYDVLCPGGDTGPGWGNEKLTVMRSFSKKHPDDLKVDSFYNDRFGYNMTFNVNGYLKKM